MTQALIRRGTGEILDPNEVADLKILTPYGAEPVAVDDTRIDAIATISAGKRGESTNGHSGLPTVSRDGTIVLHDPHNRAPHLKAALEATGYKSVTIAFPFNNPAAFVQTRFTEYSSTALLAYGDEYSITKLKGATREVVEQGTPEYDAARARCKVSTSVYFGLAAWDPDDGPVMKWDDGMALYRMRFTSLNSLRSLKASLDFIRNFTGGLIRGVPLDISIDYRDVAGQDGTRRNVPVWTFFANPPGGLTQRTLLPRLREAINEGKLLQIAPPSEETEAVAEGDFREMGDEEEVSESDVRLASEGGRCDAQYYERVFFAAVRPTRYASEEARDQLMLDYTREHWQDGETDSLAEFLRQSSEREASAFIAWLQGRLDVELKESQAAIAAAMEPGKQRLDTSALSASNEPRPLTHAQRTMARQAAAVLDSTPFVVPDATPIDAPVIELGANANPDAEYSEKYSEQEAVSEPRGKSATRRDLEKLWGQTWNHAARIGLKDYTKLSGLSDTDLINATTALSARIREHERNSHEVDERDLNGEPTEGPSLPLGL